MTFKTISFYHLSYLIPAKKCSATIFLRNADREADLIAMFRLLPSYEREDFFDLIYFKYKKHVEKKEGSIYSTYFSGSRDKSSGPAEGRETRDGTA